MNGISENPNAMIDEFSNIKNIYILKQNLFLFYKDLAICDKLNISSIDQLHHTNC